MSLTSEYFKIENVIQHRREQRDSVKGKDTPYRVEFRFRHGTRHYQYFTDLAAAMAATDAEASYGPTGVARIEHPLSQQVQVKGPRGGWNKPSPTEGERESNGV